MKKLFITISFMLVSLSMIAGNDKSNDPEVYYGAEEGGFSLSFGALPVINFVGNLFNGTTDQSFSGFGGVNPNVFNGTSFSGKYFFTDKVSFTVGAGFNCLSNKTFDYNKDYSEEVAIYKTGDKEAMLLLGFNYLLRPGMRFQPVMGVNAVYVRANKNFEKQDDLEDTNVDFNHKTPVNTVGLIANLGVEFFFCKSVSISALLDMGLTTSTTRNTANDWDEKHSYVTSKQVKFMTGKMGGNLAVNFYF